MSRHPPSVAVCRFSNTGEDWYVLVGVAKDLILNPRSVAGGFVYTYKLVNGGEKLEFLHKVRVGSSCCPERCIRSPRGCWAGNSL